MYCGLSTGDEIQFKFKTMSDTYAETYFAVALFEIGVLTNRSSSNQHDQRRVNSDCPRRLPFVFVLRLLPRPDSSAEIHILVYIVYVYYWHQCNAYRNVIVARRHQSVCR